MQSSRSKSPAQPREVTLRDVRPADVPTLFAFESDPAWRAMAMVKPRSAAAFEAVGAGIFEGWAAGRTEVVQKAILADGAVCGTIGCHLLDGRWTVGYGLGRAFWGRGHRFSRPRAAVGGGAAATALRDSRSDQCRLDTHAHEAGIRDRGDATRPGDQTMPCS